jgi:hypothetical protein
LHPFLTPADARLWNVLIGARLLMSPVYPSGGETSLRSLRRAAEQACEFFEPIEGHRIRRSRNAQPAENGMLDQTTTQRMPSQYSSLSTASDCADLSN